MVSRMAHRLVWPLTCVRTRPDMPLYLDTRGLSQVAVAICGRCHTKVSITKLVADPNSPGLRVCNDTCVDLFDPWRLPARRTEDITLQYPRPDEPLTD